MKYLVTGAAGFIGSATAEKLLAAGHEVVGIDNINDYYDMSLKQARLDRIQHANFRFIVLDIADRQSVEALVAEHQFDRV
ncbi:SDR family NAD(P)-dependent oxidoreductase, partial [Vibrio anguillarum]|uniref:SDR family NAD(P)-dependent oxidoreductase n=1 Tax=Vibrio anguillarum TaxID=55601 RepID=UPI00188DAA0F